MIIFATTETIEKRIELCMACEHLKNNSRCKLCGCWVRLKARIDIAHCPIDKW